MKLRRDLPNIRLSPSTNDRVLLAADYRSPNSDMTRSHQPFLQPVNKMLGRASPTIPYYYKRLSESNESKVMVSHSEEHGSTDQCTGVTGMLYDVAYLGGGGLRRTELRYEWRASGTPSDPKPKLWINVRPQHMNRATNWFSPRSNSCA